MDPVLSISDLVKKWCNKTITGDDLPDILYYYAKTVKHVNPSDELIQKAIQAIAMFKSFNGALAMHDIVSVNKINVTEVWSKPNETGQRYLICRIYNE